MKDLSDKKYESENIKIEIFYASDSLLDMTHYKNICKFPFSFHVYSKGKHNLIRQLKDSGDLNQILNNL